MAYARTLDNGLQLRALQWTDAPVASVYLWMDAGTADETPEEAGLAHLLEHMLFKGTPTRGVGDAPAEIEAHGGDLDKKNLIKRTGGTIRVEL